MFTGIIEGFGTVKMIQPAGEGKRIGFVADFSLKETSVGDSIAVNGACLTAVHIDGCQFDVDVSPETVSRTTFASVRIGDRVNLERAMRLSDRIDGHLVSGHIDGVGTVKEKKTAGNAVLVTVGVAEALARYMIQKGSVAVDGISLTINDLKRDHFQISIIPHTAKLTTIIDKKIGTLVNVETDMIGKYVERFTTGKKDHDASAAEPKTIDMQFLAKSGFL